MGAIAPWTEVQGPGGRSCGIETLCALCAGLARVRLITFRHNWFDDAQQQTFLLLAEGRSGRCAFAELIPLGRIDELAALGDAGPDDTGLRRDADGGASIGLAFVEPHCRDLIRRLAARPDVIPLSALGEVGNGYVPGANAFFHCTAAEGEQRGLPPDWLLPVARDSRSLTGLAFDADDVATGERRGAAHHLILPRQDDLFSADHAAPEHDGERLGIPARYNQPLPCPVPEQPAWPAAVQPGLGRAHRAGPAALVERRLTRSRRS